MIYKVVFYGGPLDGLAQGWNVDVELPDEVLISPKLGMTRGGIRLETTSPEACGVVESKKQAKDAVTYIQVEPGRYHYEPPGFEAAA